MDFVVVEILFILLTTGTWIAALVVAGMKGRWVWLVLGIFFWLPAYVGAFLPPRPDSSWAQRRQQAPGKGPSPPTQ